MNSASALQLQGVSCTFVDRNNPGQRYTAVRDVDLTVVAGEFLSVVGPTGCGKSTLLNVAAGLLMPSTGSVKVFGQPLAGVNGRAGYMFHALFATQDQKEGMDAFVNKRTANFTHQ